MFRDAQVSLLAERVAAEDLPFVVPLDARSRYVGTATSGIWPTALGGDLPPPTRRRRHRRLAGRPGRSRIRPRRGRPAGPRVLRAHDPVHPRHRARVAAVGAPGLPALPHAGRASARTGERPMNQREALRGIRSRIDTITLPTGEDVIGPRLDPIVRRQRRTDLRRDLHHLPTRGPRLRQRRLPAAPGQLHRDPGAAARARRRSDPHQPRRDDHPGHYLTYIDPRTGELTALAVHGFAEQLDVYVEDDELRAEHAFWVFGFPFLVLHYRIGRKPPSTAETQAHDVDPAGQEKATQPETHAVGSSTRPVRRRFPPPRDGPAARGARALIRS